MIRILNGDALAMLRTLPDASVHCCVTSPPYWGLRDYGVDGQQGLEPTPEAYVAGMVGVFAEVRRVLRDDGTLWLNVGDSYAANRSYQVPDSKHVDVGNHKGSSVPSGCKPKDLVGIPWMLAFALRADGWYLRQDIIWHKPNPMPESVTDRCTKAHEYVFLLSKSARYFWDRAAIAEPHKAVSVARKGRTRTGGKYLESDGGQPGGNRQSITVGLDHCLHPDGANSRSVWSITTKPCSLAHFATMPPELAERCILAGCPKSGTVLDPYFGAGTTGLVADRIGRDCIGIELNPEYVRIAQGRIRGESPLLARVEQ